MFHCLAVRAVSCICFRIPGSVTWILQLFLLAQNLPTSHVHPTSHLIQLENQIGPFCNGRYPHLLAVQTFNLNRDKVRNAISKTSKIKNATPRIIWIPDPKESGRRLEPSESPDEDRVKSCRSQIPKSGKTGYVKAKGEKEWEELAPGNCWPAIGRCQSEPCPSRRSGPRRTPSRGLVISLPLHLTTESLSQRSSRTETIFAGRATEIDH